MQELGNAINESLSDSDRIAAAIGEIKRAGYDVFLVLEATIGFNKREETDEDEERRNYRTRSCSRIGPPQGRQNQAHLSGSEIPAGTENRHRRRKPLAGKRPPAANPDDACAVPPQNTPKIYVPLA